MPIDSFVMDGSAGQVLRDDDSLLRQVFFGTLRHHHPNLANKVDVVYALSQAWCNSNDDSDFELLESYLAKLLPEENILVRACSPRIIRERSELIAVMRVASVLVVQGWEALFADDGGSEPTSGDCPARARSDRFRKEYV